MRVILLIEPTKGQATRITPACAGNTMIDDNIVDYDEDHPRMCG